MKKKLFKVGLLFTMIFSFLLPLLNINTTVASAKEEIVENIELTKTERKDNTISFTTKEEYSIEEVTYEIVYYGEDNQKYADLVRGAEVTKINDFVYSFEVSEDIVGVKVWQLEFFVSTGYTRLLQTSGNNYVGEIDAIYKKNYVEVTTDKLEVLFDDEDECDAAFFGTSTCEKIYVFYFNLDTVIDRIIKLDMRYSIKTEKKTWWGINNETWTKSYEVTLDHTQQVTDYEAAGEYFSNWYETNKNNVSTIEALAEAEHAKNTFKRDVLGANINGNGYDWYIQPLLDVSLYDKEYIASSGYQKQDLQEVAIIKMSYYAQGEYFEDIPVLDEPTGWISYEEDSRASFWDKIKDFFTKFTNLDSAGPIIICIVIIVLLVSLALSLVNSILLKPVGLGIDKQSRLKRSNDKIASIELQNNKEKIQALKKEQKRNKQLKKNSYNGKSSKYYNNRKNY